MKKIDQKGFGVLEILVVIVIIGLLAAVGWLVYDRQKNNTATSNSNNVEQSSRSADDNTVKPQPSAEESKYLEIKEYGIKIEITEGIKDAYYKTENNIPYLTVHGLDEFPACSHLAAVAKAKVGDDNVGSPWTKQELEKRSTLQVGEEYFWVELGNGGSCTGSSSSDKETAARKGFSSAKLLRL